MSKTTLSFILVLGLCAGLTGTAMASEDDTYMDWSYASGLEPKPRPNETVQKTVIEENITETADGEGLIGGQQMTGDWQYTADFSVEQYGNRQNVSQTQTSEYAAVQNTGIQQNGVQPVGTTIGAATGASVGGAYQAAQNDGTEFMAFQTVQPVYRSVPISTIQTPAQVQYVNNPIKVQYPITKQYPISVQYPVTIQKDVTVRRPVIVQQPIVVQRPIVMQQPVMVQQQPTFVQKQPVMVQQQPTFVQKQPIIVPVKVAAYTMPRPAAQQPCANVRTYPFSGTTVTTTGVTGTAVQASFTYPAGMPVGF